MKNTARCFWLVGLLVVRCGSAADTNELSVVHQIKVEAFQNSKVMATLEKLTDQYGPRLTASPEWEQAAGWAMAEMKSCGLTNVHEEKWGPFGRSWSIESYNLDMLTPRYSHLVTVPLAWSSGTNGVETADLIYAPYRGRLYDFNLKRGAKDIEMFETAWHGKLKGKIVLITDAKQPSPSTQPIFSRLSDERMSKIEKAPAPEIRRNITVDQVDVPTDEEEANRYFAGLPNPVYFQVFDKYLEQQAGLAAFLKQEGVIGVIKADMRSHNGSLNAELAGSFRSNTVMAPPTFVVTEEQYSRMQRLVENKQPVKLRMELKVKTSAGDVDGANIIAEIPGQKKPEEIVMIGAHFDSWHSGTGATDNGAGSAVMLEVMRVLKTLNLPMDRTVRIGLWSGEEQGLLGSQAWVKAHLGDVKTGEVKAEHAKFDIYLNLDNGSGKIRGVYMEGNDAIRPLFESYLSPFRDMDVAAMSEKNTAGTDHQSFDDAGLPAFQFVQDPLDYSLTHHSDTDTYSHAVQDDLMQASAVIATLVYDFANRSEMAPRKIAVKNGKLEGY